MNPRRLLLRAGALFLMLASLGGLGRVVILLQPT